MNKLFCSKEFGRFVLLIVLIFSSGIPAYSATFTVTKTADTNDNLCNADCSLREAIAAANAAATDDEIKLDSAVFSSSQTITVNNTFLFVGNNGELKITRLFVEMARETSAGVIRKWLLYQKMAEQRLPMRGSPAVRQLTPAIQQSR